LKTLKQVLLSKTISLSQPSHIDIIVPPEIIQQYQPTNSSSGVRISSSSHTTSTTVEEDNMETNSDDKVIIATLSIDLIYEHVLEDIYRWLSNHLTSFVAEIDHGTQGFEGLWYLDEQECLNLIDRQFNCDMRQQ
jgi:hypothetical protein